MSRPPFPEEADCIYCGTIASQWDHVISVALLRPSSYAKSNKANRYKDDDWLVPACVECNCALQDRMLHSVPLRAKWLYSRYRKKYQKLMLNAVWTEDDLEDMSASLRALITETMFAQAELDLRLAHLLKVANKDMDYGKPK